ncbi:CLUMA_CG008901, isoform A [Clunio marinus]|uniref:CLUMA_CG008901, isoform A n=1 Tax=Clunio marinus TaxID=568069 RepID=A0A1J1I4U4_9DIPT|nr:CLUMA_CG008901, isoform A [Clunio marinus]
MSSENYLKCFKFPFFVLKVFDTLLTGDMKEICEALKELLKVNSFGKMNERNLMIRENKRMMRIEKLFFGLPIFTCLVTVIKALSFDMKRRELPFKTWVYWDYKNNLPSYWFTVIIQCVGAPILSLLNFSIDMIQIAFMHYLNVMLKEFSVEIESLEPDKMSFNDTKEYDRLCKCVDCFVQLKDLGSKISTHLSTTFFIQAILSALILCTSTFLLTTLSFVNEAPTFIRTTFYCLTMLIQIFLPCYYGNEVTLTSDKISTTLFHSKWVDGDQKYKKAVTIFMENTKRSIKISAFGFVFVDIETLTTICNTTYSLYALVSKIAQK